MYKRLLVPVDGSELSERAIRESVELARQLGASIVGFVAEPLFSMPQGLYSRTMLSHEALQQEDASTANSRDVLARFAAYARAAGVEFEGLHDQVPRIDKAIIAAAEASGCDLIVMVTHGRGAFGEFLYGSQTKAVLAGSKLPLLVLH